ncbi:transcriptional regulator, TetR family [Klenkia marina]|uniref:Transcriptional regulator, TetR family n=1 Tax=Klenkia marina TaxID=1960309 RepID=A0A1G4YYU9_9ACTN|nr:TetR/AcrR family transcriptional regulator [Klenkia marina]SCX58622.1 transcriptional regulator, TetR family [Klenkia marina]
MGRPRDPALDVAILRAALDLLAEGGLEACALDEVARRAGVGKATIYRRWPSKDDLVRDAFEGTDLGLVPTEDVGSLVEDCRRLLLALGAALRSPRARAWRRTVPALGVDSPLAGSLPIGPVEAWNEAVLDMLDRARRRGEVAADGLHPLVVQAACSTVMARWFTNPDGDEAGERVLVEQLLTVLVAPHLRP